MALSNGFPNTNIKPIDKINPALTNKSITNNSAVNNTSSNLFDLGQAYDNNLKMKYRQQGIDALKPPDPFKLDLASIQSDPTYQAAMESARQATQVAEGNISSALNRRGILDSTITANAAANAAQQEYGRVNRELLPKLIEDQYKRYIDQNNLNRQYASDLFGVSDMYANDDQTAFNNAITESSVTGNYLSPEARGLANRLVNLKNSTEAMWSTLTPEQRQAARAQGDQLRAQLQALGVDPALFGADVTGSAAQGNLGQAGIRTVNAQAQDYNQMDRDRNFNYGVGRDERADFVDDRNYGITLAELTGYLPNGQQTTREQQRQLENLWAAAQQTGRIPDQLADLYGLQRGSSTLEAQQLALSNARESRIASGGGSRGSGSSGSDEYTGGVINDLTAPRTAATMETWIINNIPGGIKTQGPPPPNQLEWIETQLLNNPNLSEKDLIKLYNRFGIPLPE